MSMVNTSQTWGWFHQCLHWLIAIAVIGQLVLGLVFSDLAETDPLAPALFAVHASLGGTILAVMLVRLVWRLVNPVPRLPDSLQPAERRLARANHWLFYILLIGMPVGGYLMVNAHGHAVPFYGWELPMLIGQNETLAGWLLTGHLAGAVVLVVLMALHVAGALRHEFMLKDNTLRRMTPLPERASRPANKHLEASPAARSRPR